MNRFAKMKKERIYTLFETLSVFLLLVMLQKMRISVNRKKFEWRIGFIMMFGNETRFGFLMNAL